MKPLSNLLNIKARLILSDKPQQSDIDLMPERRSVRPGQRVTCFASAFPPPAIRLFIDQIGFSSRGYGSASIEVPSETDVRDFVFICIAENSEGKARKNVTFSCAAKEQNEEAPREFSIKSDSMPQLIARMLHVFHVTLCNRILHNLRLKIHDL